MIYCISIYTLIACDSTSISPLFHFILHTFSPIHFIYLYWIWWMIFLISIHVITSIWWMRIVYHRFVCGCCHIAGMEASADDWEREDVSGFGILVSYWILRVCVSRFLWWKHILLPTACQHQQNVSPKYRRITCFDTSFGSIPCVFFFCCCSYSLIVAPLSHVRAIFFLSILAKFVCICSVWFPFSNMNTQHDINTSQSMLTVNCLLTDCSAEVCLIHSFTTASLRYKIYWNSLF